MLPLPGDLFGTPPTSNPVIDLTHRVIDTVGNSLQAEIPDALTINNDGGEIRYDAQKRTLIYDGKGNTVHLITDSGLDVQASHISADLATSVATLDGPLAIYQGESLTRAQHGTFNWETQSLDIEGIRAKVNGILIRGSRIEYEKDHQGKPFMKIHDAYITTDDMEKPDTWIGAGELSVYQGDYGRLTRLSIASGDYDVAIPILGWFSFSHSLNPQEGYLPHPGTKSIWGAYLLNQYGFLLGNRRVEGGMPVADYVLTTHADYRSRRGFATGIDLEDCAMVSKYKDMGGLQTYVAFDKDQNINPSSIPRENINSTRYRIALQAMWELDAREHDPQAAWTLASNINLLSDRYILRDFFEQQSRTNDQPDNTVRVERRSDKSQWMFLGRFAPNNYYATDQRAEISYYRVRSAVGKSGLNYETNNSFAILGQKVPTSERFMYRASLDYITDPQVRDYYARMLNTSGYLRFNSTHELTTSFRALGFLNITPKAGAGYSGYYSVEHVGADNRYLGYLGCDFDMKFHREFNHFSFPRLGWHRLVHVIRPYTTVSHCSISSSNDLVPKIDTWSSVFGNATNTPMALDLMGFTGIDGWGTWTIWRVGLQNTVSTTVDGESRTLLDWNIFLDYNEENPNTDSRFSNLYSIVSLKPTERMRISFESQTPTFKNGDGFSQYNTSFAYQPFSFLEGRLGHRYINNHPLIRDSSQVYARAALRLNEKYTVAGLWYWDVEEKRLPIQQYSLFRKAGSWYIGATLFLRDNGGKRETGFGISFTLGETGTALPVNFF